MRRGRRKGTLEIHSEVVKTESTDWFQPRIYFCFDYMVYKGSYTESWMFWICDKALTLKVN